MKTIGESSEHLLSLINDVLDMSRIESGKMVLDEKDESLPDILHALHDIVRAGVRARRHRLAIDAIGIRDECVRCDKLRLNQLLFNLVSNAINYTPPGGAISLRLVQKPSTAPGRARCEFRCKDNGIGMDEEFIRTVFDPFTRARNSTVSGIQGTGLGMAIAKNIVDMMGGHIAVASKKGEGTEFTVTLDFAVAARRPAELAIPELAGQPALVVASDPETGQNLADMLRQAGLRSDGALAGEEAAARAEESLRRGAPYKICLVDTLASGTNPREIVRRLRQILGEAAAIVIVTADDWVDIEAEARADGVTAFLGQPVFPSDLHKVLLQICGMTCPVRIKKTAFDYSLEGKKILMVDDSHLNLKIGVILLREKGALVDTAENGRIALDLIREKGTAYYDVVVMDVQMPVMDGYEATAAIRALPGGGKLKIIAFSANAFEEDKDKSRRAGMNGHITKPLKITEFLAELRRFGV